LWFPVGFLDHRDLKPENVILIADPETPSGERAKLLDFGIAKQDGEGDGERRTTAGMALGTPTYMAPEQCEGRPRLTDRVDVYALGVMLYELLAGAAPFRSDSISGVMCQHLTTPPPPLPDHVPEPVAMLVRAMLTKEATERPSMTEVVERIDRLDSRADANQTWRALRTLPPVAGKRRRKRLLMAAGAIGFLFLVLLLLLILRGRGERNQPPQRPAPPFSEASVPTQPPKPEPPRSDASLAAEKPEPATASHAAVKSRPAGRSHGESRIIFGNKKSNKNKKSAP